MDNDEFKRIVEEVSNKFTYTPEDLKRIVEEIMSKMKLPNETEGK